MGFVYEEVGEEYEDFYNSCRFMGPYLKEVEDCYLGITKWTIDRENEMALVFAAPGLSLIESPRFYDFVFFDKPEERIRILVFMKIKQIDGSDGQYDQIIDFDAILIPTGLVGHKEFTNEKMIELIKEAFSVYSRGRGRGEPSNITFEGLLEPEIVKYGTEWGSRKYDDN